MLQFSSIDVIGPFLRGGGALTATRAACAPWLGLPGFGVSPQLLSRASKAAAAADEHQDAAAATAEAAAAAGEQQQGPLTPLRGGPTKGPFLRYKRDPEEEGPS